jgi:hypothetical protein
MSKTEQTPLGLHRVAVALTIVPAFALTACGADKVPVQVEHRVIQYVDRPVACPPKEERERLRKLRPTPLREQPMPATAVERNAKSQAQLGLYEAEGGYADQVDAALNRCQTP